MSNENDPDEQTNHSYNDSKNSPMPSHIVALHQQVQDEVTRLCEMMKTSLSGLYAPGGYQNGLKWIGTEDGHGQRSEFSVRLASARALFKALGALEEVAGVERQWSCGPDPKNRHSRMTGHASTWDDEGDGQ